jgi:competence protein ComEC
MKKRSRRLLLVALVVVALAVAVYLDRGLRLREPEPGPGPLSGKLVVRFLDVGQGDAGLIHLPDGETILIDSGDRGAPTDDLLRKYGVKSLDLVIATHPHADHIGDMRDVISEFTIKEFWDAGFAYSTKTYTDMLQEIKDRRIRFSTPKQGETRRFGRVSVDVLHPAKDLPNDNPNNASIVVRLTFGSKRFLFTGDTEHASWRQMIDTEKASLRADVLKAAHHGSSNGTDEAVLDAVRPSIYAISCAGGNEFHHPQPKVMSLLAERRGISVYRTDLQGTITAVCDGNTIEVHTEKQVAAGRLYLTGDEVAGKVADGAKARAAGKGSSSRSSR